MTLTRRSLLVGLVTLGTVACGDDDNGSPISPSNRVVTFAEYQRVQVGMTYEEVVAIVGAPGVEESRAGSGSNVVVFYRWKNDDGSSMGGGFINGRLEAKYNNGLG